ncbi:MAG TPA: malto-oligosyltrehalose trehalohydrolase [Ignavibacteriaceae bacterium]|nr:malto-oligosyltrehalose trehalohydrolase [Ignavibacteriaceae bacterium]
MKILKLTEKMNESRKIFIGAELFKNKGVHFRVYAPKRKGVSVVIGETFEKVNQENGKVYRLESESNGYFSGLIKDASSGNLYKYLFEDNSLYPDPASFFQPYGPHGPSEIIDPDNFNWSDSEWKGITGKKNQIIYEMHVGTFSQEGIWESAKKNLEHLKDLGVTIIEIMPVAEFSGKFGWGYDGVNLFAPYHVYGRPEAFKDFINSSHLMNIGVILDVVYNHLGPDGNYMSQFTDDFLSDKHNTDWGKAVNFDGDNSQFTRDFIKQNALYWCEEFHLDGLRFDATQDIVDESGLHILLEIVRTLKDKSGRGKYFVAENEPQNSKFILPAEKGGLGIDSMWNDDFHHSCIVALTGRNEAYYSDYLGQPQEFISSCKYGFLYQGQYYKWQKKRRGTPSLSMDAASLVNFIQNHDQIANSGRGLRIHKIASLGSYKAITALMILSPGTPMLFQGQEYASDTPFYYFADHKEELSELIYSGRTEFMSQFRSIATPEMIARLPVPSEIHTFVHCKLNIADKNKNKAIFDLHKDLIKIKKEDPVLMLQQNDKIDGAVLNNSTFVLRYFGENNEDRIFLVNLGVDLHLNPAPEPLLSPPTDREWQILWSSEDIKYGGNGTAPLETENNWIIPGHAAVLLQPAALLNSNIKLLPE